MTSLQLGEDEGNYSPESVGGDVYFFYNFLFSISFDESSVVIDLSQMIG